MKKPLLVFVFILLYCTTFLAQAQKGSLTDMAFLEGHWQGTFNGGPIDAVWIAPAGDNLTGFIRMMKDDKVTMYEMLIFEQTDNGPVALVKHFKPGLIGVEEKDKQDRYRFLEARKNYALYEKEDGSIRIIYEKKPNGQLVIQRGQPKDSQWAFSDLFVFKPAR
ncbi:DUF6265 family protein [Spirosoma sp. SC4-14]|uniref:DUF6265 family protein n=1 Tax=Spirosoma sp. SC4-14 TaxID=3128900 RepID=UPI0030CB3233